MTGYPKMMLPQNVSCHWQFIKWCCGVPAILGYCALHVFDDAVMLFQFPGWLRCFLVSQLCQDGSFE